MCPGALLGPGLRGFYSFRLFTLERVSKVCPLFLLFFSAVELKLVNLWMFPGRIELSGVSELLLLLLVGSSALVRLRLHCCLLLFLIVFACRAEGGLEIMPVEAEFQLPEFQNFSSLLKERAIDNQIVLTVVTSSFEASAVRCSGVLHS